MSFLNWERPDSHTEVYLWENMVHENLSIHKNAQGGREVISFHFKVRVGKSMKCIQLAGILKHSHYVF